MAAPHYRKVELQSPADFTYLYANTVALSRQKLDLNLPLSATNDGKPDPMRERVRELVDEVRPTLIPTIFLPTYLDSTHHPVQICPSQNPPPHKTK